MQTSEIGMKVSIRKHPVKTASVRSRKVILPSAGQYVLMRRYPHQPMQLISLFQYLLTVAETHDSSQQPTDFNILPPFIAMWKLYGIVLNEAGAMIGCRPLPKLSFNLLGHLQAFVFSSEMQRYCKSNAKLSCLHEKVVPGYSLSYLKILHL